MVLNWYQSMVYIYHKLAITDLTYRYYQKYQQYSQYRYLSYRIYFVYMISDTIFDRYRYRIYSKPRLGPLRNAALRAFLLLTVK